MSSFAFPEQPDKPKVVSRDETIKIIWGDELSERVPDWLFAHTTKIHSVLFRLQPGGFWKYSPKSRAKPVYSFDMCCYVLRGALANHDPETGEVRIAREREVVYFRKNTWWFGYNVSSGLTEVFEWMAPTSPTFPSTPPAESPNAMKRYRPESMGDWPMRREGATGRFYIVNEKDQLHMVQGETCPIVTSLFVNSDLLTVGSFSLAPGKSGDPESHPGDESLYVERGKLDVLIPERGDRLEVREGDAFFCPEGTTHQYYNTTQEQVKVIFGVAPKYL